MSTAQLPQKIREFGWLAEGVKHAKNGSAIRTWVLELEGIHKNSPERIVYLHTAMQGNQLIH